MRLTRLTLFILFLNAISGFAQTESCRKSTEGTDFWFGFMEGRNYQTTPVDPVYNVGHYCEITITSSYTCNYQIFIGNSAIATYTGTVSPNVPVKRWIDWRLVEATGSEVVQTKAIHLTSDNPLNLYALNWSNASSEVALIFPTKSLGNEYYTMCYTPHINGNGINSGSGRNSEFLVVASENNTVIGITPTKVTDQGKPANGRFQITLNKGEVYQVQSENLPTPKWPGQGDLTGSYITSDKPIAVYSGSLSTTVPGDANVNAWDHLYEQMPPMQTWGMKFIAVPLKTRHEDTYRILAAEDNTTVLIGNKSPVTLMKGIYYEFSLLYTEPSMIKSDKPILLAQFSNSNSVDKTFTGGDGDPFMVIVSPVNQTREKVAFVAYDSPLVKSKFFINVVVKDDAVGAIKLDNVIVSFVSISGTGYSYAQVPIAKGNHYIESTVAGKGFIAYVYGFGGVEAYGYGVGYNLDIVLDLGSNINALGRLLVRCDGGPPLTLNAGNAFDHYLWSPGGETTSTIQVSNAGWYKVTASITDGCKLIDSVEVQVSKPILDLGLDTTICNPETIVLDAGARDQFISYSWTAPSVHLTDQKITISNPGTYSVAATNIFACTVRDSIKVSFTDKPKLDLSRLDTLMCGKFTTTLDISADKTVNWMLESGNPKVNINNLTASVSSADEGTYPLVLTAKDEFSCATSSTIKLGFYKSPVVDLGRDSTICNPENIKLNAGAGFASYVWSTTETTPGITVKKDGLYSVNIIDKNGCKTSDEMKVSFTDNPKLDLSALETLICGTFGTTLKVKSDKDVTYSLVSDPRININGLTASVAPADFGTYAVTLTAKDIFSCSTDTTFKLGFYKTPKVDFTIDAKICSGYNLSVSYVGDADTVVSNFNWVFGGDTIANKIGLNSLLVPLGINRSQRDLTLTVTQDGCDSTYTQKDIKVIPNLDMQIIDNLGCEPFNAEFTAKNTEVVVYDWDFGDGTPVERSDNHPFHNYQKAGYYNVSLKITTIVTNGEGCSNEVKIDSMVHVAPIPDIGFSLSPDDCLNPGVNQISYSGAIGTVRDIYDWDLSKFDPSEIIKDPQKTQGPFSFDLKTQPRATLGLKVISEFGCESIPGSIMLKRMPDFSIKTSGIAGCIPFEPILSGITSDKVDKVDFTWDFGDNSTATGSSVTHTYIEPNKKYNLILSGTSSITGCSNTFVNVDSLQTYPKPKAVFSMDNLIVYNDAPTVNFLNESFGDSTYLWNFGDGTTSDLKDPSHYYKLTGYRTVLLEVFNEFLCSDTISHRLLVAFSRIFPPNAFSPNAPNAVDREFKLGSDGIASKGYHFTILSRWNDIVFEARDEIKGWDGHMNNGSFAPAGTYVWVLDFSDFLGRRHRQSGTVTVVY